MKVRTILVAVSFASCAGGAVAADGVWNYENTAGLTADAPADWSDPANWVGGTVPSGQNASAFLVDKNQTESLAGTLRYIRVPEAGLTLGGISSRCGVKLFVTGGPIALTDNATGMGYSQPSLRDEVKGATYCDVVIFNAMTFGNLYLNRCAAAGCLRPATSTSVLTLADSFRGVPYRQATTDSESIDDPSYNGWFRVGSNLIGYYAPTGADATNGFWKVTEGSSVLERVGEPHELAAGQHVTGAGIPDGAFVTRIYSASLIEISAPATASSENEEGTELSFAAFSPVVRQNVSVLELQGSGTVTFAPMKLRPQDDVVYTVGRLTNTGDQGYEVALDRDAAQFNVLPGGKVYPARTVFRRVDADKRPFRLINADVMFDDGLNVTTTCARVIIGSQWGDRSAVTTAGRVTVAVDSGKVTSWPSLEEFKGSLTKTGAGELAIVPTCASLGTVAIEGGGVSLSGDATARTLASLSLAAGASFSVGEGQTVSVASATLASGSSLHVARGARVELPCGTSLDGVTRTGDGSVVIVGYGSDIKPIDSGSPLVSGAQLAPGVKGTPAFWVTADSLAATTPAGILEQVGDKLEILRWKDCRGADAGGDMFATNRVNRPYLVTSGAHAYVKFPAGSNTKETNHGLIWDRPLTNIRAVFTVVDTTDGFGSILGSSSRLTVFDFLRGARSASAGLFYDNGKGSYGTAAIANPRSACYLNGEELPSHATNVYEAMGNKYGLAVIEVEATGDCRADAFASCNESGAWNNRWDLVGGERLYECIVYTNTLSYIDRYNIHAYLMRKYGLVLPTRTNTETFHNDKRTRVSGFAPADGASGQVKVEAGCSATVPEVTNGANLEKTGDGTLYVTDARDTGALRVRAGTLVVRSSEPAADLLPADAALRFDASDLTTLTYAWDASRGLNTITKWTDVVKDIAATLKQSSHTNRPFVLENALNGKSVVDFGPALKNIGYNQTDPNPCLVFTPQYDLKTVFSVIGSERGGCTLLGGSSGRQDDYAYRQSQKTTLGIWRDVQGYPGDLSLPLVESDGSPINGEFTSLDKLQVRQNGAVVDQTKSYFSGAYDLFSLNANTTNMESSVLGAIHYANSGGGMQLAETIFYKRNLDLKEIEDVEAYLDWKWFNRRRAGYAAASAEAVDVAAGAVLRVEGGAPLTMKSLAGAGTVEGAVRLAAASVLDVTVDDIGAIETVTVSGAVDLSAGGTVVLGGATDSLAAGTYEILKSGAPIVLDAGTWTVDASAIRRRFTYALKADGNSLYLEVAKLGALLIVR